MRVCMVSSRGGHPPQRGRRGRDQPGCGREPMEEGRLHGYAPGRICRWCSIAFATSASAWAWPRNSRAPFRASACAWRCARSSITLPIWGRLFSFRRGTRGHRHAREIHFTLGLWNLASKTRIMSCRIQICVDHVGFAVVQI